MPLEPYIGAGGSGGGEGGPGGGVRTYLPRNGNTSQGLAINLTRKDADSTWRFRREQRVTVGTEARVTLDGATSGASLRITPPGYSDLEYASANGIQVQVARVQHAIPGVQAHLTLQGATSGSSLQVRIPTAMFLDGSYSTANAIDLRLARVQHATAGTSHVSPTLRIPSNDSATNSGLSLTVTETMKADAAAVNTGWTVRLIRGQHEIPGTTGTTQTYDLGSVRVTVADAVANGRTLRIRNGELGGSSYINSSSSTITLYARTADTWQQALDAWSGDSLDISDSFGLTYALDGVNGGDTIGTVTTFETSAISGVVNPTTGTAAQPLLVQYSNVSPNTLRIRIRATSDNTMAEIQNALIAAQVPSTAVDGGAWTWQAAQLPITGANTATIPIGVGGLPNNVGSSRDLTFSGGVTAVPAMTQDALSWNEQARADFVMEVASDHTLTEIRNFLLSSAVTIRYDFGQSFHRFTDADVILTGSGNSVLATTEYSTQINTPTIHTYTVAHDFAGGVDVVDQQPMNWVAERHNLFHFYVASDHTLTEIQNFLIAKRWLLADGSEPVIQASDVVLTGSGTSVLASTDLPSSVGGLVVTHTFAGGINREPLEFTTFESAKVVRLHYDDADTLAEIEAAANDDVEGKLLGGTSGNATPVAPPATGFTDYPFAVWALPGSTTVTNTNQMGGSTEVALPISGSGTVADPFTIADGAVGVEKIDASGTRDATTYLRGDGSWQEASGGGTNLPSLAAGQSYVGPSQTPTDIATQAELDAHAATPHGGGSSTNIGYVSSSNELNNSRPSSNPFNIVGVTSDFTYSGSVIVRDLQGNGLTEMKNGDLLIWDDGDSAFERVVSGAALGGTPGTDYDGPWIWRANTNLGTSGTFGWSSLLPTPSASGVHPRDGDIIIRTTANNLTIASITSVNTSTMVVGYFTIWTINKGDYLTSSSNIADSQIPDGITRDTELTAAIATHAATPHGGGSLDVSNLAPGIFRSAHSDLNNSVGSSVPFSRLSPEPSSSGIQLRVSDFIIYSDSFNNIVRIHRVTAVDNSASTFTYSMFFNSNLLLDQSDVDARVTAGITTHTSAADPHSGYATDADVAAKQDTLPVLAEGQAHVGPSLTATDIATQAELNVVLNGASISGTNLLLTKVDGSTPISVPLPTGGEAVSDGVVTAGTLDSATGVVTLTISTGGTVDIDLSALQSSGGLDQTAVDARVTAGITTHVGETDPHSQYATDTDLTTHAGAADPHTAYLTQDEVDARASARYTDTEKTKLAGVADGATANVGDITAVFAGTGLSGGGGSGSIQLNVETPVTQANIYTQIKEIIQQGDNITLTENDTDSELSIASTGGGATDITGKADTDLGNVSSTISTSDRADIRDKIGATIEEGEEAVGDTAWSSSFTISSSAGHTATVNVTAPTSTSVEKYQGVIEVDVESFSGFRPHGRWRTQTGSTFGPWKNLNVDGDSKTHIAYETTTLFSINLDFATAGSAAQIRYRITDQEWTEKGEMHDEVARLANQEAVAVVGDTDRQLYGKADTDLGNVDSDLSASEKTALLAKIGGVGTDLSTVDSDLSDAEKSGVRNKIDAIATDLSNLDSDLSDSEKVLIREKIGTHEAPAPIPFESFTVKVAAYTPGIRQYRPYSWDRTDEVITTGTWRALTSNGYDWYLCNTSDTSLYRLDRENGSPILVDDNFGTYYSFTSDPTDGRMWGVNSSRLLVSFTADGTTTSIGTIPLSAISATDMNIGYDEVNDVMYLARGTSTTNELYTIDLTDASASAATALTGATGTLEMFEVKNGRLLAVFYSGGTERLYSIDASSGACTEVFTFSNDDSLSESSGTVHYAYSNTQYDMGTDGVKIYMIDSNREITWIEDTDDDWLDYATLPTTLSTNSSRFQPHIHTVDLHISPTVIEGSEHAWVELDTDNRPVLDKGVYLVKISTSALNLADSDDNPSSRMETHLNVRSGYYSYTGGSAYTRGSVYSNTTFRGIVNNNTDFSEVVNVEEDSTPLEISLSAKWNAQGATGTTKRFSQNGGYVRITRLAPARDYRDLLSDDDPSAIVSSTTAPSAGTSEDISRADHDHANNLAISSTDPQDIVPHSGTPVAGSTGLVSDAGHVHKGTPGTLTQQETTNASLTTVTTTNDVNLNTILNLALEDDTTTCDVTVTMTAVGVDGKRAEIWYTTADGDYPVRPLGISPLVIEFADTVSSGAPSGTYAKTATFRKYVHGFRRANDGTNYLQLKSIVENQPGASTFTFDIEVIQYSDRGVIRSHWIELNRRNDSNVLVSQVATAYVGSSVHNVTQSVYAFSRQFDRERLIELFIRYRVDGKEWRGMTITAPQIEQVGYLRNQSDFNEFDSDDGHRIAIGEYATESVRGPLEQPTNSRINSIKDSNNNRPIAIMGLQENGGAVNAVRVGAYQKNFELQYWALIDGEDDVVEVD